ncbi:cyanophycinase [Halobacillus sp. Nhm2S1]|uniref:cyanophycinase n=1 Tax=Halobacillus sp. Nhm2S1 TaxID=2866716 RepID=UPI001C73D635|nr:cyanophycinase [Halobacillus sp. Nhm2S1]MBX0359462.1 cyanophycinase [Halobacillus sp. Nhm2S1]
MYNRKWLLIVFVTALTFSSFVPGVSAMKSEKSPIKGNLVIVGGALGSSNSDVYKEFIHLAGGEDDARIGIIPAASGSLKSSIQFKEDMITYGVNPSSVEILELSNRDFKDTEANERKWKSNAQKNKVADQIKQLTGIWFVGGDQLKITDTLLKANGKNTKALDAIWDIYQDGAVLGGTSAGAAIMSDVMITGGDSLGGFNQSFIYEDISNPDEESVPVFIEQGLGFFQWGIVDQHFNERSRLGRLTATALKYEDQGNYAYGIDEDTAMVVSNEKQTIEVIGRSTVTVLDVSHAAVDGESIKELDLSYLAAGDQVNVQDKSFHIDEARNLETTGYEYFNFEPLPATGVLTSYGTLPNYLSYSLVDNEAAGEVESYLYDSTGEGYELTFNQTADTKGYWGYKDGQKDSYSIAHVTMNVTPINVQFNENGELFEEYEPSQFTMPDYSFNPDTKGMLIMAGGALGSSNAEVYQAFIERAGESGKYGIIPAASSSLKSSHQFRQDLISYGVGSEKIEIIPLSNHDFKNTKEDESLWLENKNDDRLAEDVKSYDAIWFVGGDQTDITDALLNEDGSQSKVLESLWEIYEKGAVLGGTSAGAAIMSDVMIAGGGSFDTLSKGFTKTYDSMSQQEGGPTYLEKGLGFFPYGIIDQHFDNKARIGRLIGTDAALGETNEYSYGIDEDTALILDNKEKSLKVVGRAGVSVIDVNTQEESAVWEGDENIRLSWLTSGDQLNLDTEKFSISDHKVSTTDYEYFDYEAAPHSGVLTPHAELNKYLSYALLDNVRETQVKSYSFNKGKGFELTFREGEGTEGFWGYKDGNKDDYSFLNVYLDIQPVEVSIQNR